MSASGPPKCRLCQKEHWRGCATFTAVPTPFAKPADPKKIPSGRELKRKIAKIIKKGAKK